MACSWSNAQQAPAHFAQFASGFRDVLRYGDQCPRTATPSLDRLHDDRKGCTVGECQRLKKTRPVIYVEKEDVLPLLP